MNWLNYHHLLYFWTVVREGSIRKAAEQLRVSAPAVSTQIKKLEESLGEKLLYRSGRKVAVTDMGRTVFSYADEIFTLGRELLDVMKNRPTGRPLRLDVGVADVLPKIVAERLIEPALSLGEPVRVVCREATTDQLLARLALHEIDVVLSDTPADPHLNIRVYNHLLGECGITFVARTSLAKDHGGRFPQSLHRAPMLLPTENTGLRRSLDGWFEAHGIRPDVVGEFEDHALLRAFGQTGRGIFPVASFVARQLQKGDDLRRLGSTEEVRSRFFAISGERKLKHPAVVAICETARRSLFA